MAAYSIIQLVSILMVEILIGFRKHVMFWGWLNILPLQLITTGQQTVIGTTRAVREYIGSFRIAYASWCVNSCV